jgi:hypothetical protein
MFAFALSCSFLSNPFDLGSTTGAAIPDGARSSGRVLLSTTEMAQQPQPFFPTSVTIPDMQGMKATGLILTHAVPLFSQRIFESVVINILTLGCSAVVLLCAILVLRRCNLATTVLPMFYSNKPKNN